MSSSATTAVASNQYFRSIDGLRILAAVNIVLFHLETMGGFHTMGARPAWLFAIIKGPMFHASLFFILAGFIYTIKYAAHATTFSTKRFFWSRIRTLYPLHAAATLAMVPFVFMHPATGSALPWLKALLSTGLHLSLLWAFFPIGTYGLNAPSWALSAFFFCYLLFGPALKMVIRLEKRRTVIVALALVCIPALIWSGVYASTGFDPALYQFFHIFAPIRFFEFVLGMLLARLYQVSTHKTGGTGVSNLPVFNDLIIVVTMVLLYLNLALRHVGGPFLHWVSYHVVVLPLFATLLYRFARGTGRLPALSAISTVRLLGQCSFYPYLLHIPLSSWICYTLTAWFGYKTFLHHPINILLFIAALYGLSAWYWNARGKRKHRTHSMAGKVGGS